MTDAVDSSGNGLDGTYREEGAYPLSVAGIIAGDGAKQWGDPSTVAYQAGVDFPALGFDMAGDFSIECWLTLTTLVDQTGFIAVWLDFATGAQVWLSLGGGGFLQFNRQDALGSQTHEYDASAIVTDGNPHHYVLSYDATVPTLYIDASPVTPLSTTPYYALATFDEPGVAFQQRFPLSGVNGIADELAFYGYGLSSGQVAAHYGAAPGGIATYTSAVLADSPAAYYHLNDGFSLEGMHVGMFAIGA